MSLLPPKGPYAVSTLTLEIPGGKFAKNLIRSPFRYKNDPSKVDPFGFQTTLVTLFYPTALKEGVKSDKLSSPALGKPLSWLNEPRLKSIEGLLRYGNLSRYLAYPAVFILPFQAKLPYGSDGPVATESPSLLTPDHQEIESPADTAPPSAKPNTDLFPVGVFSHGMAGTRTTYSSYLSELASHGMIIASVEHRDGSATYTQVKKKDDDGKIIEQDRLYTKFDDLEFDQKENGEETTVWDMRKSQVNLRKIEMLEALDVLHQLNEGNGDQLAQDSTRSFDNEQAKLSQWKSRLDMENVWALGHSYGGATSIEILRDEKAPFTHAVVLDPWLEAIPKAGEGAPLKRPLYVINSEGFTIWRKHFGWLRELVNESNEQTGRGWLATITKTKHTDFSDFPFLMPRFFKPAAGVEAPQAAETLSVFSRASRLQFIDRFDKSDLGMPVRDERAGEVEAKDLGQGGFVVWHPLKSAPSASL
ncbi:uncharacterized protein FA14DRAFT_153009 [Meira miltonrushii]|uniref:Putative phospholipase n=1 Tax=Meira miltonrushii TaxID=1280837 RepID=A0A316VK85_9BASI|nr:uncharacterized protein FA14DRAFT_153009 [Meira miltonrushii]PWN37644.1 hypothetical protein FA14DRAFT_153009 [Meira miltonrushii]